MLGRPGEPHPRPRPGQALALRLVDVGHQRRERRLAGKPDDHLCRGAEIHGGLDQALDTGPVRGPRVLEARELELLWSHDRVAAIARPQAVRRGRHGDTGVQPQLSGAGDPARHQVRDSDEPGHELGPRPVVDRRGRVDLLHDAMVHDRDAIRHRERLFLVVRDVDERDADVALDVLELDLEFLAELQVERAEGLVQEQHGREVDQGARERDSLLLASGQLARLALGLGREADAVELGGDAAGHLIPGDALAAQAEGDVLLHAEVREERVALEDRVGRPLEGRQIDDVDAVDQDAAVARALEAGDHPQRRRLAAAARPEQREELAPRDRQIDRADRGEVPEALRDPVELHARVERGITGTDVRGGHSLLFLTGTCVLGNLPPPRKG